MWFRKRNGMGFFDTALEVAKVLLVSSPKKIESDKIRELRVSIKKDQDYLSELVDTKEKEIDMFESLLNDSRLYIDTNIFMDERFTKLFDILMESNIKILLLKEQYTELYNLKRSTDNENKAKNARMAFRYIEKLQELEKLDIAGIDIKDSASSYADPFLIQEIVSDLDNNMKVIFFTEDMDLKIRLREQLKQKNLQKELLTLFYYDNLEFLHMDEIQRLESQIQFKHSELERQIFFQRENSNSDLF